MNEDNLKILNLLYYKLNKVLEEFKKTANNLNGVDFDYKLNKLFVNNNLEIQINYHMKNKGSKNIFIEIINQNGSYSFYCLWDGKNNVGEEKSFNNLDKFLIYIEKILDDYVDIDLIS
jgi:hypothetical protein